MKLKYARNLYKHIYPVRENGKDDQNVDPLYY